MKSSAVMSSIWKGLAEWMSPTSEARYTAVKRSAKSARSKPKRSSGRIPRTIESKPGASFIVVCGNCTARPALTAGFGRSALRGGIAPSERGKGPSFGYEIADACPRVSFRLSRYAQRVLILEKLAATPSALRRTLGALIDDELERRRLPHVRFATGVIVRGAQYIKAGKNVFLDHRCYLNCNASGGANAGFITLGDNVEIGPYSIVW